ncbi:GATOR complex protein WDR59-like [Lytechinus variegatus]|uniref:GATOR complex protein WDR59-like n=1 Tax=Lytechinus variegatus TaxID=7654 RepID=UPI001BB171A1|nr:GATOR complex protein WDR59-like [Lytechinus variegatus]
MSTRWTWTAENVSVQSCSESQATAMALDSTGDYVLLAGRRGIDVLHLTDMPHCKPQRVKHKTTMKWDISVAEWNPHAEQKNQFVTASNQTADVFTLSESEYVQAMSLKAHTRTISNLNWSVFDPNLLATSSVDTYIYIWDTRESKKPASAFSTFAGAGQVKWNRKDEHCLATVHDGDIRLWDKRKGNQAVKYISAHVSKIYSLDWDPNNQSHLITASQDCSAKVWDTNNEQKAVLEIRTDAPQWKVRYTPFGDGLITITMPQLRQREKNLLMWTQSNPAAPIHSFTGHSDDILEFQWRPKDTSYFDYHMVTWARDYTLRIWRVEPYLQRLCGVEVQDLNLSGSSEIEILASPPKSGSSVGVASSASPARQLLGSKEMIGGGVGDQNRSLSDLDESITSLEQEFKSVARITPQTSIEPDLGNRSCLISASNNRHTVRMKMSFPPQYPIKVSPKLSIISPTTLDNQTRIKVLEVLNHSCMQQVELERFCISTCFNQLINIMEGLQLNSPNAMNGSSSKLGSSGGQVASNYGSASDKNIPFPRTSGARFCSTDKLVMFTRPNSMKKSSAIFQPIPKALSALSQQRGQQIIQTRKENQEGLSITRFYKERENKHRRGGKHRRKNSDVTQISTSTSQASGMVFVFDTSCLLPIHQKLAETYVLIPDDVPRMCSLNANAAAAVGRKDLLQVWSLASLASSPKLGPHPSPDTERPWAKHPMGRQLLKSLMDHYSSIHDVQTLAMLSCVFGENTRPKGDHINSPSIQRFFVSPDSDSMFSPDWITEYGQSLPESPDDYKFGQARNPEEMEKDIHRANIQLIDPSQRHQLDKFKKKYADILYKWNLLEARAELLKYMTYPERSRHSQLDFSDFGIECRRCKKKSMSVQCKECKKYAFACAICHVAVRGASIFCLFCGHGGHTQHMLDWFKLEKMCPTGCGCMCERESQRACEQDVSCSSPITPTISAKR